MNPVLFTLLKYQTFFSHPYKEPCVNTSQILTHERQNIIIDNYQLSIDPYSISVDTPTMSYSNNPYQCQSYL